MRWIDLFFVGGVISNKLYHVVMNLFDVMLDGFEST
jgi:NADH:ubiquinone oxidoreductase subunit B-like Fe-S oxidoreductase